MSIQLDNYDDSTAARIPSRPGIYAFYLRNISLAKFGIYHDREPDEKTIDNAKTLLERRVNRTVESFRQRHLSGQLAENRAIGLKLDLVASETVKPGRLLNADSIQSEDVVNLIDLLERTSVFHRPLYVGITSDRTLRERYKQHRYAFDAATEDTFGGRLRGAGILWEEVVFRCVSTNSRSISNGQLLEATERYLLTLTEPIFSKR